jgi:hypothetical protein
MPSDIIGLTATSKILNSASLTRDNSGMQTLTQVYTMKKTGIDSYLPEYLDPHPNFPTMATQQTSISYLPGGFAQISINYLGLIEPGMEQYIWSDSASIPSQPSVEDISLPKGKYSIQPAVGGRGTTWFAFPGIVNFEFISPDTQKMVNALTTIFTPIETFIPLSYQGTSLPQSPVPPGIYPPYAYRGLVTKSISFEKRGFFNIVRVTFSDYIVGSTG